MASHPLEPHAMIFAELEEPAPQLPVRDHLARAPPAFRAPAFGPPLRDPVHDVLGVTDDRHLTALLEGLERLDDGEHLHPVVRRPLKPAGQFTTMFAVFEDGAVPARTGIAGAGAICVDGDGLRCHHSTSLRVT